MTSEVAGSTGVPPTSGENVTPEEWRENADALTGKYQADADKIMAGLEKKYGLDVTPPGDNPTGSGLTPAEQATGQAEAYRADAQALFARMGIEGLTIP